MGDNAKETSSLSLSFLRLAFCIKPWIARCLKRRLLARDLGPAKKTPSIRRISPARSLADAIGSLVPRRTHVYNPHKG